MDASICLSDYPTNSSQDENHFQIQEKWHVVGLHQDETHNR